MKGSKVLDPTCTKYHSQLLSDPLSPFLFVGLFELVLAMTSKINGQLGFYLFINVANAFRSFVVPLSVDTASYVHIVPYKFATPCVSIARARAIPVAIMFSHGSVSGLYAASSREFTLVESGHPRPPAQPTGGTIERIPQFRAMSAANFPIMEPSEWQKRSVRAPLLQSVQPYLTAPPVSQ